MKESGILHVVATPIGNLGDITLRAMEVLAEVDYIVAEDTREIRKLLTHYQLAARGRVLSYFRDNERRRVAGVVNLLEKGASVALVSARGTPGISDPAYLLVREAITRGIKVQPVPGASSLAAALSVCGAPSDRFLFLGFLPRRPSKRRRLLENLNLTGESAVIYESPFRVAATLVELRDLLGGEREVSVCRELTKVFEEIWLGSLSDAVERFGSEARGEFIIIIGRDGGTRQGRLPEA